MKTYARYTYNDTTAKIIGNEWLEVEAEFTQYFPSGKQIVVVLNGIRVKAKYCEIIQIF